ncbi:glycosyltransferase family 2 protein [Enterobacteriaceae bacterium LUAb1]
MTDIPKRPTISVIIPVYNVLDYVQEAVDSILNQSSLPTEVIIVDDGSDDGSGDYLETLYGSHPDVNIIHTVNRGLGEARNTGTRAAIGDFIYYFDSDDISVSSLIATFNQVWQQQPDLDIFAFSADAFIDPKTQSHYHRQYKLMSYRRGIEKTFASGEDAFNAFIKNDNFSPSACFYIYRRALQVTHQLCFLPVLHEDESFTPRLFFQAGKVVVTDSVFFHRRVRVGSIMQSRRSEKNALGYLRACEALEALTVSCRRQESRHTLKRRIIENLVMVMSIRKKAVVPFSAESEQALNRLKQRHRSAELRLASCHLFCWRVMNFIRKQIRAKVRAWQR